MTTFTINEQNNIVAFASPEQASATTETPFDSFTSQQQLGQLAAGWPAERLVEIWNSLPGVTAVKRFTSRKTGVKRIWARIQGLGDSREPAAEQPAESTAERMASAAPQTPRVAAGKDKSSKKTTPAKKAAKAPQSPASAKGAGAREGSKTAKVLDLLKRPDGATLKEIMKATGWQPHSVRGFIGGTLGKKMALKVESAKRDDGERVYSLSK